MLASLCDLEYCEYKSDSGSSTAGSGDEDAHRTIIQRLFRQADLNLKARHVSSSVYFCQLFTSNFSSARLFIVYFYGYCCDIYLLFLFFVLFFKQLERSNGFNVGVESRSSRSLSFTVRQWCGCKPSR